ncbi:DUF3404 domain-containing protein [Vibrio harveyi]|uniref:ATP-binding protein n=1 Tax=Vibrio harveyi TaxID=669 RepID=UPI002984F3CB|nr:DUF3404 domain-containing protein [Vibrio harveyi]HDM8194835.1 DUF3404 domain-containing protein [Vibrio harveyi]
MFERISFLLFGSLLSCLAHGETLQNRWQELYQNTWQNTPYALTQNELSRYPPALLKSSALYPDFKTFTWHDLRLLNTAATHCQSIKSDNAKLNRAIEFELALCRGKQLKPDWFSSNDVMHPAGGGYADRYLKKYNNIEPQSLMAIAPFTTISNPINPLHRKLGSLSPQGRDALLNGYRAWLEADTLWLGNESGLKAVSASVWQPLAQKANLSLQGENCAFTYSNLCIAERNTSTISWQIVLTLLGGICLAFIARLSFLKHKQRREKRFILQLLTHELRTPITSLGLTVDIFRHQFDDMDETLQDTFWRLVSDYQRLSQLTENSKTYLSTSTSDKLLYQIASLEEWLTYCCEKNNVRYQLNQDKQLSLPYYWLTICLENLVKNAQQHGAGAITVHVQVSQTLTIEVQDEGQFPSYWQRLFPSKAAHSNNMGIGLDIVKHLMKMANGKLIILRNPTRCILELPYEDHSAD